MRRQRVFGNTSGVTLLAENVSTPARGMTTRIASTFNSGWQLSDIRRAYLADNTVGSASQSEISKGQNVTDLAGWVIPAWYSVTSVGGNRVRFEVVSPPDSSAVPYFDTAPAAVGASYRVEFSIVGLGASNSGMLSGTHGGASQAWGNSYPGLGNYSYPVTANGTGNGTLRTSVGAARSANASNAQVGDYVELSLISARIAIPDRSYKANGAPITGTLTKTEVASAAQLVAYSGFSAANYLQEPYSADLNFGVGEWSVSAWVNAPVHPQFYQNLVSYSNDFVLGWGQDGLTVTAGYETAGGLAYARIEQPTVSTGSNRIWKSSPATIHANSNTSIHVRRIAGSTDRLMLAFAGSWGTGPGLPAYYDPVTQAFYGTGSSSFVVQAIDADTARISLASLKNASGTSAYWQLQVQNTSGTSFGAGTGGVAVAGFQLTIGAALQPYEATGATVTSRVHPAAARAHSAGPLVSFGVNSAGFVAATAHDGTTTRTVTTTSAYNTGTWLKARVNYTTDGTLAILVNGVQVAATRGNPLLTLNNANAVLTIGNSFSLDAPFPGSIALLKLSATVPTAEQAVWMYEQEKHLFQAGAQCCLPDAGAIADLTYDEATDKWIAISATNESEWSGLVRTSVTAVPAGSYTRAVAGGGVQLLARSTTTPGVDVTIPAYGLREELVKRAEAAARLNAQTALYDFVGGFTANTTSGNTAILSIANLTYPTRIQGARVTGAGIPANASIADVSGATGYLSATATATGTAVQINLLDFALPTGLTATAVSVNGVVQREGPTAAYTRLFDGFREVIRFAVAPGNTAWVQIQTVRSAA